MWLADFVEHRMAMVPGGAFLDPAQFNAEDAVVVNVGAAGAAANATSVPVDALSGPIPDGTVLSFPPANSKKFIKLTAAAAAGATSLTCEQLATALVDADITTYPGVGTKRVPSGTLLGRTFAERDANTPFGPAVVASDNEIFLLVFDVPDADVDAECELLRHKVAIYENFLPNWANLGGTVQAKIRELYLCLKGVD
jgi:hypothetical protein